MTMTPRATVTAQIERAPASSPVVELSHSLGKTPTV
jgi:hypothetical protein